MKLNIIITSAMIAAASVVEGFVANRNSIRAPRYTTLAAADETKSDDDATMCLITGASRGIGKCIAHELNRAGNVKIIINDITPMKETAEEVSAYHVFAITCPLITGLHYIICLAH